MEEQWVRSGDMHSYTKNEADVDQFEVDPMPRRDFAQRALEEAQDKYFQRYPDMRRHSKSLIWVIRKKL